MDSITIGRRPTGGDTLISAQAAKKKANAHLEAEGSPMVALNASRSDTHGVWVVDYRDPDHPDEMLIGGALVVTDEGAVHGIGSTPDAVDLLMESLGRSSTSSSPTDTKAPTAEPSPSLAGSSIDRTSNPHDHWRLLDDSRRTGVRPDSRREVRMIVRDEVY